jgi:hypothetical protein
MCNQPLLSLNDEVIERRAIAQPPVSNTLQLDRALPHFAGEMATHLLPEASWLA